MAGIYINFQFADFDVQYEWQLILGGKPFFALILILWYGPRGVTWCWWWCWLADVDEDEASWRGASGEGRSVDATTRRDIEWNFR